MTPRVLDHTMVHINNKNDFNSSKVEALEFIQFYEEVIQSGYETGTYQYQLIENTRIFLQSSKIRSIDRKIVCNYRINIMIPLPLQRNEQNNYFNIDKALEEKGLDYLYHLKRLVPSKD